MQLDVLGCHLENPSAAFKMRIHSNLYVTPDLDQDFQEKCDENAGNTTHLKSWEGFGVKGMLYRSES